MADIFRRPFPRTLCSFVGRLTAPELFLSPLPPSPRLPLSEKKEKDYDMKGEREGVEAV